MRFAETDWQIEKGEAVAVVGAERMRQDDAPQPARRR